MAEWIAEFVLSKQWPPECEQWATGLAGIIKIGDIVSDCFFVHSLFEFRGTFGPVLGVEAPNVMVFIVFATIFTIVGILFDLYKAYIVVKEHRRSEQNGAITTETTWCEAMLASMRHHCFRCRTKDLEEDEVYSEEAQRKFAWWKRSNLIWEEIPQLIILVAFYITVRGVLVSCDEITDIVQQCNDTYSSSRFTTPSASPTFREVGSFRSFPSVSPSTFRRHLDADFDGEDYFDVLRFDAESSKAGKNVPPIPKLIVQTSPDNSTLLLDRKWQSYRQSLVDLNPQFTFLHFDDEQASEFIDQHFPDTALRNVYKALPRAVMKADVFRLAAVYVLGGFYMDMDVVGRQSLEPLTDLDTYGYAAIFPKEWKQNDAEFASRHFGHAPDDDEERWQVGNYAFGAVPRHEFVLDALNEAVARSFELLSSSPSGSSSSSSVSDLDVLRSTGPYMLSEVYHGGRKVGKYADVHHIPGDDAEPVRPRAYGHNDWHKFGRYAEHMLSHTWTSAAVATAAAAAASHRQGAGSSGGFVVPVDALRFGETKKKKQRELQTDFYNTPAPTSDFYAPTPTRTTPSPSASPDFYPPTRPTPAPAPVRPAATNEQCDTAERLIESCTDDQENAQVELSVAQKDLYLSSILSTVFTLLTIVGVLAVWCRERRKGDGDGDGDGRKKAGKAAAGGAGATQHTMGHSSSGAAGAIPGYPAANNASMGPAAAGTVYVDAHGNVVGYPPAAASMGAPPPPGYPAATAASMASGPVPNNAAPGMSYPPPGASSVGVTAPAAFAPTGNGASMGAGNGAATAAASSGRVKMSTTFQGLKLDCASAPTNAVGLSIVKRDGDGRFYVQRVREGGAAEAEGTMREGDEILAIQGEPADATWPLERLVQSIRNAVEANAGVLTVDVKRVSYEEYFSNEA